MHFLNNAKLHKIENSNISKDVEQKVRILMVFGWAAKGQILNISKDVEQKSMFLGEFRSIFLKNINFQKKKIIDVPLPIHEGHRNIRFTKRNERKLSR